MTQRTHRASQRASLSISVRERPVAHRTFRLNVLQRLSTLNYTAPAVAVDLTTATDPRLLGLNADERAAWQAIQEAGCRATTRGLKEQFHWGSTRAGRVIRALRAANLLDVIPDSDIETNAPAGSKIVPGAPSVPAPTEKVFMEPCADTPVAVDPFNVSIVNVSNVNALDVNVSNHPTVGLSGQDVTQPTIAPM
ncbi:MAG: hypothetical protein JXR84_21895 [Anaerolineae bacterium]|nr:hypothetical protein [Anaerolineae bacterium]